MRPIGTEALNSLSDDALRLRAATGCRLSLRILLERHARTAAQAAFSVLHNRDDALDVAQETLFMAARSIGSRWNGGTFKGFIAVSARRIALNRGSAEAARRQRESTERTAAPAAMPGPQESAELAEALAALRQELAALPPATAEVIALHHLHEMTLPDVASQTGLSVDACKQRLVRGREDLGRRLRRRGIALGCLALLAGLAESTRAMAQESAASFAADWAARAARIAPRLDPLQQFSGRQVSASLSVAMFFFVLLGLFMAVSSAMRAHPDMVSSRLVTSQKSDKETGEMKSGTGKYASASLLAAALMASAVAAAEPEVQSENPNPKPVPVALKYAWKTAFINGPHEIKINVDDVAAALKNSPKECTDAIPGADLEAKARHLLANPSIVKKVAAEPMGVAIGSPPFTFTAHESKEKQIFVTSGQKDFELGQKVTVKNVDNAPVVVVDNNALFLKTDGKAALEPFNVELTPEMTAALDASIKTVLMRMQKEAVFMRMEGEGEEQLLDAPTRIEGKVYTYTEKKAEEQKEPEAQKPTPPAPAEGEF